MTKKKKLILAWIATVVSAVAVVVAFVLTVLDIIGQITNN